MVKFWHCKVPRSNLLLTKLYKLSSLHYVHCLVLRPLCSEGCPHHQPSVSSCFYPLLSSVNDTLLISFKSLCSQSTLRKALVSHANVIQMLYPASFHFPESSQSPCFLIIWPKYVNFLDLLLMFHADLLQYPFVSFPCHSRKCQYLHQALHFKWVILQSSMSHLE